MVSRTGKQLLQGKVSGGENGILKAAYDVAAKEYKDFVKGGDSGGDSGGGGGGGGGGKNDTTITNPYLSNVSALKESQARDAWANQGMINDAEHRAEAYQSLGEDRADEKKTYVSYTDKRGTGSQGIYTKGLDSAGDGDDFTLVVNGKEYNLETSLKVGEKTKNVLDSIASGAPNGSAAVFGGDLYVKYGDNWYSTSSRFFGSKNNYKAAVDAYKGAASSSSDIDAKTLGEVQERDAWANQDAIDDVTNRINIALKLSPEDQKDLFYSSKESSYDNTGYKVKNLTHFGDGDDFDLVIQRKTYGLEVGHKIEDTTITEYLNTTMPGNVAVACGDLLVKDGNGNWYTTSSRFLGSVNTYREAVKAFEGLKNEVTIKGEDVGEAIDIPYTTVKVNSEALGTGVVGNADSLGTGSQGALKATADGLYIYKGNQWMKVDDDEAYNQYLLEYAIQTGVAPFGNEDVLENAIENYKTPQGRTQDGNVEAQLRRLKAADGKFNSKFVDGVAVKGFDTGICALKAYDITSGGAITADINGTDYYLKTGKQVDDEAAKILSEIFNSTTQINLAYAYGDLYLNANGDWYTVYALDGEKYKAAAEAYKKALEARKTTSKGTSLPATAASAKTNNPYIDLVSGVSTGNKKPNNVDYNKLLKA